jgi:flagellar biogenesis protein FliO
MSDWVAIASYLSVGFAIVMFVFLIFKVKKLMEESDSTKQ